MAAEYIVGWYSVRRIIRGMRSVFERLGRVERATKKHDKILQEHGKAIADLQGALQKKSSEAHGLKVKLGKERKKAERANPKKPDDHDTHLN